MHSQGLNRPRCAASGSLYWCRPPAPRGAGAFRRRAGRGLLHPARATSATSPRARSTRAFLLYTQRKHTCIPTHGIHTHPTYIYYHYPSRWPVHVVDLMDRSKPHPITLLGQSYVAWWDAPGGQWRLFQDR